MASILVAQEDVQDTFRRKLLTHFNPSLIMPRKQLVSLQLGDQLLSNICSFNGRLRANVGKLTQLPLQEPPIMKVESLLMSLITQVGKQL